MLSQISEWDVRRMQRLQGEAWNVSNGCAVLEWLTASEWVCRRRLLTGRGWLVLSVPFYEYYELDSVKAKVRHLPHVIVC